MLLVPFIAKHYITLGQTWGLEYADLIQEGNIGLLSAISHFDPKRGRFSTIATYWIRERIGREIDNGGIIRIPVYVRANMRRVARAIVELLGESRGTPTDAEVAELSGLRLQEVEVAIDALKYIGGVTSLEGPGDSDEDRDLLDVVANHYSGGHLSLNSEEASRLRKIMSAILTPRQFLVLELRFEFRGRSYALEEIATELGNTRQAVEKLQNKALLKLWKHPYFRSLFRERFGHNPSDTFKPNVGYIAGRRWLKKPAPSQDSQDKVGAERREILQDWESRLVPTTHNPPS